VALSFHGGGRGGGSPMKCSKNSVASHVNQDSTVLIDVRPYCVAVIRD
jgi:hypothetical protein